MKNENSNDNIMSSSSESIIPSEEEQNTLGGSISTPAYALLVGVALENESNILSIPLVTLPTTLGKDHDTKDVSFVGLTEQNDNNDNSNNGSDGDKTEGVSNNKSGPKLSKSMCCIYYRDAERGGKLGCYKKKKKRAEAAGVEIVEDQSTDKMTIEGDVDALDGMTYVPYEQPHSDKVAEFAPNDIIRLPSMQQTDPLPSTGFYAIECTGRKIIVGGKALKKGQHAMLADGITVQIASHCFYFLLPNDDADNKKSIKVTLTKTKLVVGNSGKATARTKKRDNADDDTDASSADDSSIVNKSPRPNKKSKATPSTPNNNDSALESKSDSELLQMLSGATKGNGWDKQSQSIGTTLATRACRAAANSSKIQKLNKELGGITQRDVMNWINLDSEIFGEFERMMLSKIEIKSFNIAMGKALIRAGYTKSDVKSGRANRFHLPSDIVIPAVATVESSTMKKSPSTSQMKSLPTSGNSGGNKKPMALPNSNKAKDAGTVSAAASAVSVDINNANNGGDGSGGAVDGRKKEPSKSAVVPSQEDLKSFVEAWLARPENANVSSNLLPSPEEKEEIMNGCGVERKRLESLFYRMRKKLKQKQEAGGDAGPTASGASTATDGGAPSAAQESPLNSFNKEEGAPRVIHPIASPIGAASIPSVERTVNTIQKESNESMGVNKTSSVPVAAPSVNQNPSQHDNAATPHLSTAPTPADANTEKKE